MSKFIDLTGQQFGRWLVKEKSSKKTSYGQYWICECQCEKRTIKEICGRSLKQGESTNCGCLKYKHKIDLTGKKFDYLLCLKPGESIKRNDGRSKSTWICKCDCGKIITIQTESLRSGRAHSCGCKNADLRREDLTGQRFGKLIAIKPDSSHYTSGGNALSRWVCQCDCGNTISVITQALKSGNTQSCGCLNSKGESRIKQWLLKNNIIFKAQYINKEMKYNNGSYPRFDFAIFNEKNKLQFLIEYQGDIHYISHKSGWNTPEALEKRQKYDEEKRNLCKTFHINLIEIPYWEFDNIENILNQLVKQYKINTAKIMEEHE